MQQEPTLRHRVPDEVAGGRRFWPLWPPLFLGGLLAILGLRYVADRCAYWHGYGKYASGFETAVVLCVGELGLGVVLAALIWLTDLGHRLRTTRLAMSLRVIAGLLMLASPVVLQFHQVFPPLAMSMTKGFADAVSQRTDLAQLQQWAEASANQATLKGHSGATIQEVPDFVKQAHPGHLIEATVRLFPDEDSAKSVRIVELRWRGTGLWVGPTNFYLDVNVGHSPRTQLRPGIYAYAVLR
ncbi:MAG: hypothetical protein HYY24_23240 [Verrucomicrobia bacterium]|nr:hypothetical protein [Verrucomicrobiota bacterium]